MKADGDREAMKEFWEALIELPVESRRAALDERCPEGHPWRLELLPMLRYIASAPSERLLRTLGTLRLCAELDPHQMPLTVGPYQIRSVLGAGGMGIVYAAHQESPVRRDVALKVMTPTAGRFFSQRFDLEREALSRLSHPNIARIFDAGVESDGTMYVAMELVTGVSITRFCSEHSLDLRDRVRLLADACKAVAHAHSRGIIHRDIKPSNILVCLDQDGMATPKLIDFGIARVLRSEDRAEPERHTLAGELFGTPEYMSPEQVDPHRSLEVDVRSDIYSLGIVLYELVCGCLPFEASCYRPEKLDDLRRLVCEEPTPAPSKRRASTAAKVTSSIDRDLECVILKACEKEPDRRYQSAHELQTDLERFLNYEPVLASPPSTLRAAWKFVRRHRVPVAAAAVMFLGVSVGLALALNGRARAIQSLTLVEEERDAAAAAREQTRQERDAADRARADAELFAQYMRDVVWKAKPQHLGHEALMLDVIRESADDFVAEPPESLTVRGRVAQALAEPLLWAGELDQARRVLEIGLAAYVGREDAAGPAVRHQSWFNAMLGQIADHQGDLDASERYRNEALRLARLNGNPVSIASAMKQIGWLRVRRGDAQGSLAPRLEALDLIREHDGNPDRIFECQREVIHSYLAMGRHEQVVIEGLPVVTERHALGVAGDMVLLDLEVDIAESMIRIGRARDARDMLSKTIERADDELPAGNNVAFRGRARLYEAEARLGDASGAADRFKSLITPVLAEGHPLEAFGRALEPTTIELLLLAGRTGDATAEADLICGRAKARDPVYAIQVDMVMADLLLAAGESTAADHHFVCAHSAYIAANGVDCPLAQRLAVRVATSFEARGDSARSASWAALASRR